MEHTVDATLPEITITETDHERLTALLESRASGDPVVSLLRRELDRAEVVESLDVPNDCVTMNSTVLLEDPDTREQYRLMLVYPHAADFDAGRISIVAPMGAALLGLKKGQEIDWPVPNGRVRTIRVVSIDWQPEAEGSYTL